MKTLFCLFALFPLLAFAAGGTMKGAGTAENPWQVEDYDDLKAIGSGSYLYSNSYVLTADIDASSTLFTPIGKVRDAVDSVSFWGSLDGRSHTISNLKIQTEGENEIGFFKSLKGTLVDIKFDKLTVMAGDKDDTGSFVGGLAGYMHDGLVKNVTVTNALIQGNDYVGGLIGGDFYGSVLNSSFQGRVIGDSYVGGAVGKLYQYNSYFRRIRADVDVYAYGDEVGGLVGVGNGSMRDCHVSGSITLADPGHDYGFGYIRQAANRSRTYIGGFIGMNNANILRGSSDVNINGRGETFASIYVGGFVGRNNEHIYESYATGDVSGNEFVAGFVARQENEDERKDLASIEYAYATGDVTGDSLVAGFAAHNEDDFYYVYYSGELHAEGSKFPLVAKTKYWNKTSYWNVDATKISEAEYGSGLTSEQMTHLASFDGWDSLYSYHVRVPCEKGSMDDFGVTTCAAPVWFNIEGETYPLLYSNPQPIDKKILIAEPTANSKWTETPIIEVSGGEGVSYFGRWTGLMRVNDDKDSIYYDYRVGYELNGDTIWCSTSYMAVPNQIEIATVADLMMIGKNHVYTNFANYILTADLDLTDVLWEPIGQSIPFEGTFNGQNHTIKNLNVNMPDSDYVGLFGQLYGATVQNLILENARVVGVEDVGALAGHVEESRIKNVISYNGQVTGEDYVGGLFGHVDVGYEDDGSEMIVKVASYGRVTGEYQVGGVIGKLDGYIKYAYSVGIVEGDEDVGGLVGKLVKSYYRVIEGYSANILKGRTDVGGVYGGYEYTYTRCYFDSTLTEGTDNKNGSSTVQMMTKSNYEDWDFENVWSIDEGMSYPYFKRAKAPGVPEYSDDIPLVVASPVMNRTGLNVQTNGGFAEVLFTAQEGFVKISMIDMQGRVVAAKNKGRLAAGSYAETLDLTALKSGRYIVTLQVNGRLAENAFVNVK